MRVRLIVIVAAAGMAALLSTPAIAADSSHLNVLKVDGRTVQLLLTFASSQEISADTPLSATMEVDGRQVVGGSRLVIEDARPTMAVLALDTSGSMKGEQMTAAKEAATGFLEALPPSVEAGLVSFNDQITVLSPPTTDRAALQEQISGLKPGRRTALYDGVAAALDLVPPEARARLLVLSDGQDTVSDTALTDLTAKVAARGIAVDVVALNPSKKHAAALRTLSAPNNGNLREATSSGDLLAAFTAASQDYGARAFITGDVPAGVEARGKPVSVQVRVGDQTIDQSTTLPDVPSLAASAPAPTASSVARPELAAPAVVGNRLGIWPVLVALITVAIVLLVAYLVRWRRGERRATARLDQVLNYRVTVGPQAAVGPAPGLIGTLVIAVDGVLARRGSYRGSVAKIAAADLAFTPGAWLLIRFVVVVVLFALLAVLIQSVPLALLVAVLGGWLVTNWWLRSRANRRRKAFADELPTFLLLMASGLRAGLSFTSALDSAAADGKGEVSRQMRRALGEVQLGANLNDALTGCAERMDSEDLRWTVTALTIQREVGGNLSTILEAAAEAIKGRYALRREISTLSAEGRLSSYVLLALPLGILGFLALFRREYVEVLWTTTLGMVMLGTFCVLIILGWIWMRSIVRIKV
jgi:tight adherence protein B